MAYMARNRLNDLPDDLLCEILSNLSTKDSIRSSVISKRWKNLWLDIPVLDLDSSHFANDWNFMEFVDRVLVEKHKVDIERFLMMYYFTDLNEDNDDSFFVSWIDEVVKRRVRDLVVQIICDDTEWLSMPMSLYTCKTLVNLSLSRVILPDLEPESVVVSMPCVKIMHLDRVSYNGLLILETLIPSCPVLEELTIIRDPNRDYLEVVCVRSNSLKRFDLVNDRLEDRFINNHAVEIDAPRLERMNLFDHLSESFTIHGIGPFAVVDIDVSFDVEDGGSLDLDDDEVDDTGRTMIRDFLTAISKVSRMTISSATLEVIHDFSMVELLPQFSNLSRLHALFLESSWELLPTFLGCCPNLHTLVLEFDSLTETKPIELSYVPTHCFVSSLEFVRLRTPVMENTSSQTNLAIYFLRNCAVLKKFSLSESFGKVIKKIKKIPKRSKKCKIVMGLVEPK